MFFGLTTPDSLPVGLLVIPILMFFIIFSVMGYLLTLIFKPKTSKLKQRNFAVLVGVISAMVVLFYSSGGIVAGDVILIVLIFLIGLLYINRY